MHRGRLVPGLLFYLVILKRPYSTIGLLLGGLGPLCRCGRCDSTFKNPIELILNDLDALLKSSISKFIFRIRKGVQMEVLELPINVGRGQRGIIVILSATATVVRK